MFPNIYKRLKKLAYYINAKPSISPKSFKKVSRSWHEIDLNSEHNALFSDSSLYTTTPTRLFALDLDSTLWWLENDSTWLNQSIKK